MIVAIPPLHQYAFMAWCSLKAQGQLYLYFYPVPKCNQQINVWRHCCQVYRCIRLMQKGTQNGNMYEGVTKSFRTGRLEQELQMVQLSATRCSYIAFLWVSLVNFVAITIFVASQRVFIVVRIYFVMTQSGNFWIQTRVSRICDGDAENIRILVTVTRSQSDVKWELKPNLQVF
jgi:hypothetical protein